ncbi:MAG: DUF2341 domain-containing protein [Fibrobacteria bacterium]|nr:DUF2341 domain-containing protein [Fibrobacteria bacterium]
MPRYIFLLTLMFCWFFITCGSSDIAGTDTDTSGGKAIGAIVDENGKPVEAAQVSLLKTNFNPCTPGAVDDTTIMSGTTDAQGIMTLTGITPGLYNLEVVDTISGIRLLLTNREIKDQENTFDTLVLKAPASFIIPLTGLVKQSDGYVYIPGSHTFKKIDSLSRKMGVITVENASAGVVPGLIFITAEYDSILALDNEITLQSGDTSLIGLEHFNWKQFRKLTFRSDTLVSDSASGVYDFPLALKLTRSNFDFTQARANGSDLRFTKTNGFPLTYEIEKWDSDGGQALIWLKLDTVIASTSQTILMYAGNPDAEIVSNSAAVFQEVAGHKAVWHLSQSGTETLITDASSALNHCTFSGTAPLPSVPSLLGQGFLFNGQDQNLISQKVYTPPTVFTLSFWMKTATKGGGRIISFGNEHLGTGHNVDRWVWMGDSGKLHFGMYNLDINYTAHDVISTTKAYNDDKWHFVCAVFSEQEFALYVDGQKKSQGTNPSDFELEANEGSWLVAHYSKETESDSTTALWSNMPTNRFFEGTLDEIRVDYVGQPSYWIRLNYESQKMESNIIEFSE